MGEQYKSLREKRATFFQRLAAKKVNREKESQELYDIKEEAVRQEQNPETEEGQNQDRVAYKISCPKCGKMVDMNHPAYIKQKICNHCYEKIED